MQIDVFGSTMDSYLGVQKRLHAGPMIGTACVMCAASLLGEPHFRLNGTGSILAENSQVHLLIDVRRGLIDA